MKIHAHNTAARNRTTFLLAAWMLVLTASSLFAQNPYNVDKAGVAIKGYDVVAYFSDGKPAQGKVEFTHEWHGAKWQFTSAEHRDAFKAAPEKYAPEYGGFCAWGMTKGYKASVEPTAWKIVNNKLYLNYNAEVQQSWSKEVSSMIRTADEQWSKKFATMPEAEKSSTK